MQSKKVVVLGPKQTGKTKFVKSVVYNHFYASSSNYQPTLGVEVHSLTCAGFSIDFWDCAGDPKFGGLGKGYYLNADVALLFKGADEEENQQFLNDFLEISPSAAIVVARELVEE